jgi:hypothetical protein
VNESGKVESPGHPPEPALDDTEKSEIWAAPGMAVVETVTFEFKVWWELPPQLKLKSPRSSEVNIDVL